MKPILHLQDVKRACHWLRHVALVERARAIWRSSPCPAHLGRGRLPWFLIRLGVADFGRDCDALEASHYWCNVDDAHSLCIFCGSEREGQLWRTSPYRGARVWHDLENARLRH